VSERVLVTGAVGFIGGHTCRALLQEGREVVGLDNFDPFYDRRIKEGALAKLREERGFSFAEGDIRDESLLCELLDGVDVVVHLAARAGVRPSIEDPGLYASVNVEGTVRLLEACRSRDVRRFVFGSSSSVYGDTSEPPFRDEAGRRAAVPGVPPSVRHAHRVVAVVHRVRPAPAAGPGDPSLHAAAGRGNSDSAVWRRLQ
jgi:UDP-glucuronate 4-epimerase